MNHVLTSPWGLLVFGRVGELGEEAKLVPFLLLEDRGHIFPSIPFYHLKIALYPQKPSPVHFWAPGRGKNFLSHPDSSLPFILPSQAHSRAQLPNSPFSHLHPISFTSCSLQVCSRLPYPRYRSTVPCSKTWRPDELWNSEYFRF